MESNTREASCIYYDICNEDCKHCEYYFSYEKEDLDEDEYESRESFRKEWLDYIEYSLYQIKDDD